MAIKCAEVQGSKGAEESTPAPQHHRTSAQSWWDHQQALARFQEYAHRAPAEGADPRLLFILSQMI